MPKLPSLSSLPNPTDPLAPLREGFAKNFDANVRSRYFKRIDFVGPDGDPGWFGPDSKVWYVHSHFPTMALGLFAAAYIEQLDPSIMWMGADHSRIPERIDGRPTGRIDAEGAAVRFGHSISFFLGTAFASTESAERLTRVVRGMHRTVKGVRPDGAVYDAEDPDWLRWNYATVVWGLATAHEHYHPKPLRGAELDEYYREFVRVGEGLGGTDLPTTKQETLDCLESYLPRLAVTHQKAITTNNMIDRSAAPFFAPGGIGIDWVVRDMLPRWAQAMVQHRRVDRVRTELRRATMRTAVRQLTRIAGTLDEVEQSRSRVAGGLTRPVDPEGPGAIAIDRSLTRDDVEALA